MTRFSHSQHIRSIARWALVLFVMAWMNLVIQSPLHAAMQQPHSDHCGSCDTRLCDTVLGMEEQADDALGFNLLDMGGFQLAFVTTITVEPVTVVADNRFRRNRLDLRQYSPPPLLLKTTLLI